ncbi:mechanosensitive ion channel family protein [Robiginitalea sediminis]|uniref:mechanosensitive ion channel family protein n=1 Tax=Robiginitalea sediminis TaxID=1982593 RepID=UPI000B4A6CF6|nr:mechanosensitive ion channel domain-containing protein [Robiginitalea sediminis]
MNSRGAKPGFAALLSFLFLLISGTGRCLAQQDSTAVAADTLALPGGIPLNEVLIASGEARVRAIQMASALLSLDLIERENRRNDSIMAIIDSAFALTEGVDYRRKAKRFLTNERNYWHSASTHIKNRKKELSGLISGLQEKHGRLESEIRDWRRTQVLRDSSDAFAHISETIDGTLGLLDSTASEIMVRTGKLAEPLNQTIIRDAKIDLLLDRIQQALLEKTSLIYTRNAPSLFEIPFQEAFGKGIVGQVSKNIGAEWRALSFYFSQRKPTYIAYLIFIAGVMALFFWMRAQLKHIRHASPSYYQAKVRTILGRPLAAGALFAVFFSVAFFTDRPPLLLDITILLMLLPLLDLAFHLSDRKAHNHLWAFAGFIFLLIGIRIIPAESVLFRFVLLGLGLLEIAFLFRLYKRPEITVLPNRTLTRFVRFLVVLHLILVSVGILANVFGFLSFAQVAMESFITNALTGLVLYICAVILIGGVQHLISSDYMERFNTVRENEEYLKEITTRIAIVGVTVFWLDAILRIFYIKNVVYDAIGSLFTRELGVGSMSFTLGKVVLFIFIIWFSIVLSRVVKIILREDLLERLDLKKGIPRMITAITQFSLITLGLLMAVRSIGMPLDQLTIIFSAFSVGIGFGLQNIFNNLVSGVILLFEREVQIGDVIEVGNLTGKVTSMGIRSSHIKTFDGAEVIVPNGQLISKEVVDWTLSDKSRRIEIISGVAYGSDVHLVKKLLREVIDKHPDIKPDPEPLVLFNAMADSALEFRLLFWTANFEEWMRIRSEIIFAVHDTLVAHNISIPFPQRDLHIKSVDPAFWDRVGSESPK